MLPSNITLVMVFAPRASVATTTWVPAETGDSFASSISTSGSSPDACRQIAVHSRGQVELSVDLHSERFLGGDGDERRRRCEHSRANGLGSAAQPPLACLPNQSLSLTHEPGAVVRRSNQRIRRKSQRRSGIKSECSLVAHAISAFASALRSACLSKPTKMRALAFFAVSESACSSRRRSKAGCLV